MFEALDAALDKLITWILALVLIPALAIAVWVLPVEPAMSTAFILRALIGGMWGLSIGIYIVRSGVRGYGAFVVMSLTMVIAVITQFIALALFSKYVYSLEVIQVEWLFPVIMSVGLTIGACCLLYTSDAADE